MSKLLTLEDWARDISKEDIAADLIDMDAVVSEFLEAFPPPVLSWRERIGLLIGNALVALGRRIGATE